MSQSDGSQCTPFEQARNYAQWMIPNETPVVVLLEELRNKLPLFDFMFKEDVKELSREMEISIKAGEIVGVLYDKLIAQIKSLMSNHTKV